MTAASVRTLVNTCINCNHCRHIRVCMYTLEHRVRVSTLSSSQQYMYGFMYMCFLPITCTSDLMHTYKSDDAKDDHLPRHLQRLVGRRAQIHCRLDHISNHVLLT